MLLRLAEWTCLAWLEMGLMFTVRHVSLHPHLHRQPAPPCRPSHGEPLELTHYAGVAGRPDTLESAAPAAHAALLGSPWQALRGRPRDHHEPARVRVALSVP